MVQLIILFKVIYKYFDKSITFNCFFFRLCRNPYFLYNLNRSVKYYKIYFFSFVSFICKLVLLLLFIPSKFSFFQHYWLLQLGLLNLYIMRSEYCSTLASIGTAFFVLFTGIWGNVVVSSVIVCLIISVSYALSANMYVGL